MLKALKLAQSEKFLAYFRDFVPENSDLLPPQTPEVKIKYASQFSSYIAQHISTSHFAVTSVDLHRAALSK